MLLCFASRHDDNRASAKEAPCNPTSRIARTRVFGVSYVRHTAVTPTTRFRGTVGSHGVCADREAVPA